MNRRKSIQYVTHIPHVVSSEEYHEALDQIAGELLEYLSQLAVKNPVSSTHPGNSSNQEMKP